MTTSSSKNEETFMLHVVSEQHSAFQAERENKPLKAYLIVKRHMFTQSYLFPRSGLEGHAFHWHAAPLLSKSRKQIFGSL